MSFNEQCCLLAYAISCSILFFSVVIHSDSLSVHGRVSLSSQPLPAAQLLLSVLRAAGTYSAQKQKGQ